MADEQTPVTPPQTPAPAPQPTKPTFLDKINSDIGELWEKDKWFVIIFGALILIIKFRDILIDILVNSGKNIEKNAENKDGKLAAQENQANQQANDLVKKAEQLPSQEQPVDDDWYKKKP